MYSTKLVNKGMVSNNAYITVGDPYSDPKANPFRQGKKGEKLNPFQIKNGENGHFAKKTYVPEGYKEGIKYTSTQPLEGRKRGFGTKDASKRDEFSNNIRTEQYRETLRKEMFFGEGPEVIKEKLTRLLADRASGDSTLLQDSGRRTFSCTVRQFDIGRSQVTDFDPKSIKDTYYKFDTEHDKFVGAMTKPVSQDIGNAAWEVPYKPPTFGGRSETRNFYDKSHLNIPAY